MQVDGWNRPTHITYGSTINVNYAYDGLGNAIVSINNLAPAGTASTTDMYYAGQQMIESVQQQPTSPENGETAVTSQYVFSPRYVDSPILFTAITATYDATIQHLVAASIDTYYYLTDANYNVTTLLNSSGGVVERYVYSAYGTPTIYNSDYSSTFSTSAAGNTVLFAGMDMDMQTGLYRAGLRWLSSVTDTFITQDPAQQGADWYDYANSDPIDFTDPTGLAEGGGSSGSGSSASWTPPSNGCIYLSSPAPSTVTLNTSLVDFRRQLKHSTSPTTLAEMVENFQAALEHRAATAVSFVSPQNGGP